MADKDDVKKQIADELTDIAATLASLTADADRQARITYWQGRKAAAQAVLDTDCSAASLTTYLAQRNKPI